MNIFWINVHIIRLVSHLTLNILIVMYLYSLTLQQSEAINQAICGSFSVAKAQEICISKGKIIELMRVDENTGKLIVFHSQEAFGIIRQLATFRCSGMPKDFIAVGSDSGRITLLEYKPEQKSLVKVHQETYGKTGCRRTVPGDLIAIDPKGRALMIGALEKQKFVYIFNRDSENKITISSPLEAHKAHTIHYSIAGIDVGYENPQFACLEVDYGDTENDSSQAYTGEYQKSIAIYEMDLGLNHVIRKYADTIDMSAHLLITIPGHPDGPGGVLICCENKLIYHKPDHSQISCSIPRRNEMKQDRAIFISCYAIHRQKDLMFVLLASDTGDIFKVSFNFTGEDVHGMTVQYFDTIKPANSICILKNGFLFAASEFGDHTLYQFKSIGDKEVTPVMSSSANPSQLITYNPRELKNLTSTDELPSLSIITKMKVADLTNEGSPQIYALCGRGSRSSLKVLRHGLSVIQIANTKMPGQPIRVWSMKRQITDKYDKYIIVSFINSTMVLSVEDSVSECTTSGFDCSKSTLHCGLLENGSMIQICTNSIIHIDPEKKCKIWETPGTITHAASNERQLIISIKGGELVAFELDSTKQLKQVEKKVMDSEISCLDVGAIPDGRQRCKFLAIGESDKAIKILSLDPETCFARLSMQALPTQVSDLCLIQMKNDASQSETSQLYLHVGLSNGMMLRTLVDDVTGSLTDTRTRFLGTKPISLFKATLQGSPAMIALSSRSWLCYSHMFKYFTTPISYTPFEYSCPFSSIQCPEGIVGVYEDMLAIVTPQRLGEQFNQVNVNLKYTPRKILSNSNNSQLIIIESDNCMYPTEEMEELKEHIVESTKDEEYKKLNYQQIGYPMASEGKWASCLRVIKPSNLTTMQLLEGTENEIFLCAAFCKLPIEEYLVIATAKDVSFYPLKASASYLSLYKFNNETSKYEVYMKMPIEDIPMAVQEYKGRILVGIGRLLRMYELGKKKLLKKCENRNFVNNIMDITVFGHRVFIADQAESVHVLKYKEEENQLYIFADDVLPRWTTSFVVLDFDTIAVSDKFENVTVLRLPPGCDEEAEDDPTASRFKWECGYLNGAAFKMEQICTFYVGDVITSLHKCSLAPMQSEVILYGTTTGAIGALMPFEMREELDFFAHLEMYMRLENLSIVGRDHLSFRSSFEPVKDVIDGDLCEMFSSLDYGKQKAISNELERNIAEMQKKLEEMRNKII